MSDPIDVAVGSRVKLRRRQLGLSQTDLGSHVNLTFQQIQKYENGANRISASVLVRIADRLDCSIASLFGETQGARMDPSAALPGLTHPGAVELLRAYSESAPQHRRLVLALAQCLAAPKAALATEEECQRL